MWVEIMEVGEHGPLASLTGLIQRPLDFSLSFAFESLLVSSPCLGMLQIVERCGLDSPP